MSKNQKKPNKLKKNNGFSVDSLKPKCEFEGWATKQGGSHKSWKKRYFILVSGTQGNNKATAELYYFTSASAKSAKGVITLNERSTVKEQQVEKKSGLVIDTGSIGSRQFYLFCANAGDAEKMAKSLQSKIQSLKTKPSPGPENPTKPASSPTPSGGSGGTVTSTSHPNAPSAGGKGPDGIKLALESAKNAIQFMATEERILEFWQIWTESIPTGAKEIDVTIVINSDMSQLSWRVFGPQNVLIQEMVDFFWNVGAPEGEIDRLNDIGGLINPNVIGSWIEMSTKGGMDGGWVFPVTVSMTDALKACDEGDPLAKLDQWTKAHNVTSCITVGRDMGASPPRQTEIRFQVHGGTFETQFQLVQDAFHEFGFPVLPQQYISLIQDWKPKSMDMSVITSSEGFVRIGLILPEPEENLVTQICNLNGGNISALMNFHQKMKIKKPAFVEFQYLMDSFGYGVYNEGLNVVFHYQLDPHMS